MAASVQESCSQKLCLLMLLLPWPFLIMIRYDTFTQGFDRFWCSMVICFQVKSYDNVHIASSKSTCCFSVPNPCVRSQDPDPWGQATGTSTMKKSQASTKSGMESKWRSFMLLEAKDFQKARGCVVRCRWTMIDLRSVGWVQPSLYKAQSVCHGLKIPSLELYLALAWILSIYGHHFSFLWTGSHQSICFYRQEMTWVDLGNKFDLRHN